MQHAYAMLWCTHNRPYKIPTTFIAKQIRRCTDSLFIYKICVEKGLNVYGRARVRTLAIDFLAYGEYMSREKGRERRALGLYRITVERDIEIYKAESV